MLKGFKEFIAQGNALELAIGVVIGGAFGAVVTAIVDGLISPLVAALFGKPNFDNLLVFTIGAGEFHLGTIITALINFILVAAAVYFVIVVPLNKLRRQKAEEPAPAGPTEVELLQDIKTLLSQK